MSARAALHAGFTLLELLVVVLVLGLVAGVAALSAADGSAQRAELAAIQISDSVERARALAVSQRLAHGVVFDVDAERAAVVDATGNMVVDPLTQTPMLLEFRGPGQPQGVDLLAANFGDTESTALFDAQGWPLDGGSVVLRCGSTSITLSLDAATGRFE